MLRVVLLENEKNDAVLIENELRSLNTPLEFHCADKRADFLRLIRQAPPDLVLSDYVLPGYSGLGALEDLRELSANCPFIFVSWEIHEQSVLDALKSGATDYVFKEQLSRLTLSVVRALREAKERMELEAAHREIQKSEEYFRSLIENASDIITVLDAQGVIRYASPSVTKVLGYTMEEFVGKNILEFIHEEDAENATFVLTDNQEKRELSLEFRFRHKNGAWRGLEAIGKMVKDENGQFRTVVNSRDITDRILEQEALRESIIRHLKTQTELQKTQQKIIKQERLAAIGQMASGIAHDFSNALMPVLGFSEILLNHPEYLTDLERVKKYMQMINTSARDAMHIVGGLREFYRTKEKAENLTALDINKVVEQAVMLTQPKWKDEAAGKGIPVNVSTSLQKGLPEFAGNEASLREALTNLIFNALDAMPKGGEILLKSRHEEGHLVLEMSDTGVGMSEEVRNRCFEPFFSTKGKGGTGLGLAMVYGVVTRHEGSIDIKSQEGLGTTFILRFPIRELTPDQKEAPPALAGQTKRKLNVLVVDDESMVRDVLSEYLTGDGHAVETAVNGVTALEAFQRAKFDLVITDRAMPEMNGDQLTEKIKQLSPKTPLIMLTGFGELMKAKNECPQGVDYLLSKPLTFEAYREAVLKAVP